MEQAPHRWNYKLIDFLKRTDFSCRIGDPFFSMRQGEGQDFNTGARLLVNNDKEHVYN